ncbi:putative zinc finger FYVE domain protein [Thalictrum thalictroides]|uniref:Putative zinc finger FYVE domain protein n=1 Tax=Thalictrum thalictroides TaxID=46969 RepID=A0A7J6XDA7_THATH|nr:putative zinc finger FYVE domain protein [Thalictrum thalictroides]
MGFWFFRRFSIGENSQNKKFSSTDVLPLEEDDQIVQNSLDTMPELEVIDYEESEYDGFGEKETTPKFSFKFQFQAYEDSKSSSGDLTASTTSKYEFLPKKDFSRFMEEPEVFSFSVKEMFLSSSDDCVDNKEILDDGFLSEKDFLQHNLEKEVVHDDIKNNSCSEEDSEKPESIVLSEIPLSDTINSESNSPLKEVLNDEDQFLCEDELCSSDSEPESIMLWDKFSVMNTLMNSNGDEFLSGEDFDNGAETDIVMELDERKVEEGFQNSEEIHLERERHMEEEVAEMNNLPPPAQNLKEHESTDFDEVLEMIDDNDIEKLEEHYFKYASKLDPDAHIEREFSEIQAECEQEGSIQKGAAVLDTLENSHILETDAQLEREFRKIQAECEQEDSGLKGSETLDSLEKSAESSLQDSSSSGFEDSNLETLWEHQDLIEQLKMEIKKVKATGLPTILEESESPRMSEDLKPWKINEKFVHEDKVNGLHKVYKSYSEKMRKLDILNYQKMYAIGFLQLKDPLKSISTQRSSAPTFTSLLSQNFLLSKRRRPEADSSVKFVNDLESDLEMVYVGQLCLSWEFLYWQYEKAKELLESDPYEIRPYNQVAGEFQQFQVVMQRFLEDECFQGPRVQNYIRSRCVLRNLLQVPVIKEDPKDKEGRQRRKDAITCSMLLEILEESMRIFWKFVRADKHDGNVILKGLSGPQVKLIDAVDTDLLVDVQRNLQKKEKKLKDILRSGNCIVKRFQKHHKEQSDDQLLLFSQVDLKLVSRVLKMSRITTDQLAWCHTKLSKISFVQRKIHVEPSFLLFPC